jgi:hypothetical protein
MNTKTQRKERLIIKIYLKITFLPTIQKNAPIKLMR